MIPYLKLMRFDRPIGTLLLLWPTLMALVLTQADLKTYLIFVTGVIIMRAAGCVINDYADRNFDLHVERTRMRPLAQRQISTKRALILFVVLMLMALCLALQLQTKTLCWAIAAGGLAILYPLTKRIFKLPQLVLGVAFSWSICMVYAETLGNIPSQAWILFLATVAWVIAYDTQYAMADKVDDLRIGIKSSAITFGRYDKGIIFGLQMLTLGMFLLLGANQGLLLLALVLAIYQQWLIKDRDPKRCIKAFRNNNYFGMVLLLGLLF